MSSYKSDDSSYPPLDRDKAVATLMASRKKSSKPEYNDFHSVSWDEHHTKLGEHAANLFKNNMITDVTVKLRGVNYGAHKTVLSCYSKYFREMLLESKGNVSTINLQLQSVTNDAFSVLLQFMYTAKLPLTCQNIGEVYTAARKLGMDGALEMCVKILGGKSRHDVHSVYVFVTAKKLGLGEASVRALKTMCRRFEQIVGTPEYLDLTNEQVIEYLKSEVLATRSEVIVFLAALKWLSVRYLEREQYAYDILRCVRFPSMSMNEILACHSPPLLPGLMEIPSISQMLLDATCYVAAKSINEEKRFQKFYCIPRKYLLPREPIILWDPNIFDPDRHAMYAEEVAATTIQSAYRGFRMRKSVEGQDRAAQVIQRAYRRYSFRSSSRLNSLDRSSGGDTLSSGRGNRSPATRQNTRRRGSVSWRESDDDDDDGKNSDSSDQSRKGRRQDAHPTSSSESFLSVKHKKAAADSSSSMGDLAGHVRQVTKGIDGKGKDVKENKTGDDQKSQKDPKKDKDANIAAKLKKNLKEEENRLILVVGGLNSNDVDDPNSGKSMLLYDPADDKWVDVGQLPRALHHHRVVYMNGTVYVIGGCDPEVTKGGKMVPSRNFLAFDVSGNKWTGLPKMKRCRMYHAAAALDGKIYVVGGKDENERVLDSVEVYDPDSQSWEERDFLGYPLMGAGLSVHEGRLWVIGGMMQMKDGKITLLQDVQCYDPAKGKSDRGLPRLPYPCAFVGAAECWGSVHVVGGTSYSSADALSEELHSIKNVASYDDGKNKWKAEHNLPFPRHFTNVIAIGNYLFVLGGLTSFKKVALDDVIVLTEPGGEWRKCTTLPTALCGFAATPVPKLTKRKEK